MTPDSLAHRARSPNWGSAGKVRRLVVKVGTSTLVGGGETLDLGYVADLAAQIAWLMAGGRSVALVSSGAIRAGLESLGRRGKPRSMPVSQAAAAIGQGQLMQIYGGAFAKHGILTAQILLTRDDITDRDRYLNAKNTFERLFSYHVLPIVNENDTVAVEEIAFGDNDALAAMVASLIDAQLLLLLTNVDGVHGAGGEVIPFVEEIDEGVERLAFPTNSRLGKGGMSSKLQAAKMATRCGIETVVANGRRPGVLWEIIERKAVGTRFAPHPTGLAGRKRWLAFGTEVKGRVVVNEGARRRILRDGKSLLPVGVTGVEGDFRAGEMVALVTVGGKEFARGITSYGCEELAEVKGLRSDQIPAAGTERTSEVVHRDNMVVEVWAGGSDARGACALEEDV